MATKRPSNGIDLSFRHSNMRKQHLKYAAHLSQAEADLERKASLVEKLDRDEAAKKQLKLKLKEQARQLDVEFGFVEPVTEDFNWRTMPEWKRQKCFLAKVFVPPTVCVKYKSQFVFKNRLSMKGLNRGLCSDADWAANVLLLEAMRREYDLEEEDKCKIKETQEQIASSIAVTGVDHHIDSEHIKSCINDDCSISEESEFGIPFLDRTICVRSTNEVISAVNESGSIRDDEIVKSNQFDSSASCNDIVV